LFRSTVKNASGYYEAWGRWVRLCGDSSYPPPSTGTGETPYDGPEYDPVNKCLKSIQDETLCPGGYLTTPNMGDYKAYCYQSPQVPVKRDDGNIKIAGDIVDASTQFQVGGSCTVYTNPPASGTVEANELGQGYCKMPDYPGLSSILFRSESGSPPEAWGRWVRKCKDAPPPPPPPKVCPAGSDNANSPYFGTDITAACCANPSSNGGDDGRRYWNATANQCEYRCPTSSDRPATTYNQPVNAGGNNVATVTAQCCQQCNNAVSWLGIGGSLTNGTCGCVNGLGRPAGNYPTCFQCPAGGTGAYPNCVGSNGSYYSPNTGPRTCGGVRGEYRLPDKKVRQGQIR
jgi:hypothetical protein